jgi:toxin FitB
MILLDTHVISEPLRQSPDRRVVDWINSQPLETLFLSAIAVAELRFGVAALPAGKRREALREGLENRLLPLFAGRVLPFDLAATRAYADLMASARSRGVVIGMADGLIAATAAASGMSVATRDTAPFRTAGVPWINPWDL